MQKENIKKEVIQKSLDKIIRDNIYQEQLISYYRELAEKAKTKEKAGQYEMKAAQLEESLKFNEGFIKHISQKI